MSTRDHYLEAGATTSIHSTIHCSTAPILSNFSRSDLKDGLHNLDASGGTTNSLSDRYYRSRTQTTWVHPSDLIVSERVDNLVTSSSQAAPTLSRAQQIYQSAFGDDANSANPMIAPPSMEHRKGSQEKQLGRSSSAQASLPSSSNSRPSALTVQHKTPIHSNTDPPTREFRRISTIAGQQNPIPAGVSPAEIAMPFQPLAPTSLQKPLPAIVPSITPVQTTSPQNQQLLPYTPHPQSQHSPSYPAPPPPTTSQLLQQQSPQTFHRPSPAPTPSYNPTFVSSPTSTIQSTPSQATSPSVGTASHRPQFVARPPSAISTASVPTPVPEQQQFHALAQQARPLRGRAQTAPAAPHPPVVNNGRPPQRPSRGFGRAAGILGAAAAGIVGGALLGEVISEDGGEGGDMFGGIGDAIANSFSGGDNGGVATYGDPSYTGSDVEALPPPQDYTSYNYAAAQPPPDTSTWASTPQQQPQDQSGGNWGSQLGDFVHHAISGDGSSGQQNANQGGIFQQQSQQYNQTAYGQQPQPQLQQQSFFTPQQPGQPGYAHPSQQQPVIQHTQVTQHMYAQSQQNIPQVAQHNQLTHSVAQQQAQIQQQGPSQLQTGAATAQRQNNASNALGGIAGRLFVAGTAAVISGLISNA